jgi:predicted transcriptional regulator
MSNDTAKELARLQRRLEALSETRTDLELQIEDLEEHLAQAVHVDPYAMPAEVVEELINQLAGWPAKRWRELAALIEVYVRCSVDT